MGGREKGDEVVHTLQNTGGPTAPSAGCQLMMNTNRMNAIKSLVGVKVLPQSASLHHTTSLLQISGLCRGWEWGEGDWWTETRMGSGNLRSRWKTHKLLITNDELRRRSNSSMNQSMNRSINGSIHIHSTKNVNQSNIHSIIRSNNYSIIQ